MLSDSFEINEQTAAALGFFDGLHVGHAAVLDRARDAGLRLGAPLSVLTFRDEPDLPKFAGRRDMCLMTFDDKRERLLEGGAKYICAYDFGEIRDMSPEAFFKEIVLGRMHAVYVACGEDFRFGKGGAGDAAVLAELCREHGTAFETVPAVCADGVPVSSTRIRELIRGGDVRKAAGLLGRQFSLTLPVLRGRRLGRTIGFPTINQRIPDNMVHPKHGVYAGTATVDGLVYPAITDIGVKPTVDSDGSEVMETHIIGFGGDLYGREIKVALYSYIRDEKKFGGLEELRTQLLSDREAAEKIFTEQTVLLS